MRIGRSIDSYFFSSFPPPFSFIVSIFTFIENTYLLQFQLSRPNIVIANSLRRKNLVKKLRDSQRKKKKPLDPINFSDREIINPKTKEEEQSG